MVDLIALGEPLVEFGARSDTGRLDTFSLGWGGDTSNVAIAAARLGASAAYVSRVGDDEFGRMFRDLWKEEGVDTSAVEVDPDAPTGIYFIVPDPEGQKRFVYYRRGSAASRMQPADLDPDWIGGARVLHVSGISQAISEAALGTVAAAMEIAEDRGVMVSYDANVRRQLQPVALLRAIFEMSLGRSDIVFVSGEDLDALYDGRPHDELLEEAADAGPRLVVLKRGAEGSTILTRSGDRTEVAPFEVDAADATGAGDAFAAAFLVARLDGRDVADAGRFASAVGALTATGLGAVAPLPTREQAEEFLQREDAVDGGAAGG